MKSKVIISVAILFLVLSFCYTSAQVPKMINYQGKLTNPQGGLIGDTSAVYLSIQFTIYADSSGVTALWSETQTSVRVEYGVFNVLLGSVTNIPDFVFTGGTRYLGIKVGTDSEMRPLKPIVSTGYAYNSDMLDGMHAGNNDGDIPINNSILNTNLNADLLDGYSSEDFLSTMSQNTFVLYTGALGNMVYMVAPADKTVYITGIWCYYVDGGDRLTFEIDHSNIMTLGTQLLYWSSGGGAPIVLLPGQSLTGYSYGNFSVTITGYQY